MNIKTNLQLNLPISFHGVCTVYPLTVADIIRLEDSGEKNIFTPFLLDTERLNASSRYPAYQLVKNDPMLLAALLRALAELCHTDKIRVDKNTLDIFIDSGTECLTNESFKELSGLVSEMLCIRKTSAPEAAVPKFKTPEGYERWKRLQEQRQKNAATDNGIPIYDFINCVQFGGNYYIPDEEILGWTYWKLIHAFQTISHLKNYDFTCSAYLQCGDKALMEKHWSELIKL